MARPRVRWIVFDVGETLIDETRMWTEWADLLGVPRFTFAAALGATIARDEDHRRVFDVVAPGVDWRATRDARPDLPSPSRIEAADLYPDVVPGIAALRSKGFQVGIAGNQYASSEEAIRGIGVPFDAIASSETFGASKPDPHFYERLLATIDCPAGEVAYVGDRIENDVEPASRLGLHGVLLRRGPWATIGPAIRPVPAGVISIDAITDLLEVFDVIGPPGPGRG